MNFVLCYHLSCVGISKEQKSFVFINNKSIIKYLIISRNILNNYNLKKKSSVLLKKKYIQAIAL